MGDLFSMSLRDVLKVSASSEPTPGGGSIAAITAAFAASMVAMVANLTIGKKKYRDVEAQVTSLRDRALCLMNRAEELVDADMAQFRRFMDCYKMPASTDQERERREHLIQEALKGATDTPLEIARTCLEVLKMADEIAPIGNAMAVSDAGVACHLADAALRAALLNVDINLPQLKDESYVMFARISKEGLLNQATELKEHALKVISARIAG